MAMETGNSVKGVILDNSVLIDSDDRASLQPGADSLLRHLRHSKIPTRIVYRENLPVKQVDVLNKVAESYSLECFHMDLPSVHDDINEIAGVSGDKKGITLYVISGNKKDLSYKLRSYNLVTVVLGQCLDEQKNEVSSQFESSNPSPIYINGVQELPLVICNLIRKATANGALKVGYIMKPSRIEDFAKRGAFPVYPTQNELMFIPLTFELPLASQVQEVDIVLHKATDEIVSIDLSNSSECSSKIIYSRGMQELKRYLDDHPECCVIDPFHRIRPVLDRLETQQMLCGLEDLGTEGRCKIQAAHFLKVDDFHEQGLVPRLEKAKCSLPYIVKPQISCGVADAHSMAVVFRSEDIKDLKDPLPAIIQMTAALNLCKRVILPQFTNFTYWAKRVFHAVKKSIPNAPVLMKLCESNGLKLLAFDSLKSLPTSAENSDMKAQPLDLDLVYQAAKWLTEKLELTIFGFDVVVEERSGDHVIVDVNYLPSFKEVPDDIAIPAFWDAIRTKFESRRV